jgi:hypothetical protein
LIDILEEADNKEGEENSLVAVSNEEETLPS